MLAPEYLRYDEQVGVGAVRRREEVLLRVVDKRLLEQRLRVQRRAGRGRHRRGHCRVLVRVGVHRRLKRRLQQSHHLYMYMTISHIFL